MDSREELSEVARLTAPFSSLRDNTGAESVQRRSSTNMLSTDPDLLLFRPSCIMAFACLHSTLSLMAAPDCTGGTLVPVENCQ